MKKLICIILSLLVFTPLMCNFAPAQEKTLQDIREEYPLVWSDEFEGDTLDSSTWSYEGSAMHRNGEVQVYCDTAEENNVRLEDGNLVIEARKETRKDMYGKEYKYTSGSITTISRQFRYGLLEARIKIPKGKGAFPAFWMLGTAPDGSSRWPRDGEIDIMEYISQEPDTVHSTIHYSNEMNNHEQTSIAKFKQNGVTDYADDFHTFSMLWDKNAITMYVDDIKVGTRELNKDKLSCFKNNHFYFILNLALGGWAEDPDYDTFETMQMKVDYVRVYQNESGKMFSSDGWQIFRGLYLDKKNNIVCGFTPENNDVAFWNEKLYIGGIFGREFIKDDKVVTTGSIATGMKLRLWRREEIKTFDIVVAGDINGDGRFSSYDLLILKRKILSKATPSGIYLSACDMNDDYEYNSSDLLLLKQSVLG